MKDKEAFKMNKGKIREILSKFSPYIIKSLAVVGILSLLIFIIHFSMPAPIRWLFSSHHSDSVEKSAYQPRHYRNDLDELTAMLSDNGDGDDPDVSAEMLCNLYPKEEVCISWREKQKCFNNESCAEENVVDEDILAKYEQDVLSCFIPRDQMLDDQTISELPDDCRKFKLLDIENVWGKNLDKPDFRQIQLSGNEAEWAQKITPGHLAGIARGLKLIITENEKLESYEIALPFLEAFESFEDTGPDKEMATGLLIGLFNSAVTGEDIAKRRVSEENTSYCAGLNEDIIPVRCRIPQN